MNQQDNNAQLKYEKQLESVKKNCIYLIYSGSISHGTNSTTSDTDIRGVFIGEKVNILSPFEKKLEHLVEKDGDTVYYEITKYVNLLLNQNPLCIEYLWVDNKHIISCENIFNQLRENKQSFLSKKAKQSFIGHAFAEYKKAVQPEHALKSRVNLIEKHGYDVKSAAHSIRLLTYVNELLNNGKFNVEPTNKDLIVDIKNGKYSKNDFEKMFLEYENKIKLLNNNLPDEPNYKLATEIVLNVYDFGWNQLQFLQKPKFGC